MTSSIAGLVGSAAQAAYVAANAFQDAFARFRLSQNLPATALQLGLILEIGATVNSAGLQQSFQRSMTYGISETEFLQLVEGVLAQPNGAAASTENRILEVDPGSVAQIATGFEPARYIHTVQDGRLDDLMWSDNPRFAGVVQAIIDRAQAQHVSNPTAVGGASSIAKQLKTASTRTEKEEIGRTAFISRLAELFGIPAADIDTDRPIAHYGLDSMVTTELRSWLVKTFDVDINPLRLLSKSITIDAIVKILVSKS
jgi:acyl carrier protein